MAQPLISTVVDTPTVFGGYASWTERAKNTIVMELRKYFSLLSSQNVIKEKPNIQRYGLAGQSPQESFLNIFTALPHENQRIPFIAVMSAPGTERKMGIGRQVIKTFHDPDTGLPKIRECVGGDMSIILEISAVDTDTRSEIVDLVYSFFTFYMEDRLFSFLGDGTPNIDTSIPDYSQLIIKASASLAGETDTPRPEGEPFERIYFNRITVPIIFIDYIDREGEDISTCYNNSLQLEDDEQFALREEGIPFDEPGPFVFVITDNFEDINTFTTNWQPFEGTYALIQPFVEA